MTDATGAADGAGRYPGPIRAVILDWAGTVQDHGCFAPAAVFVEVFRENGVDISDAEARAPMGLFKLDHIRAIARMSAVATRWQQANGRDPTEDDVVSMFEASQPLQVDAMVRYATLIAGTVEAVDAMRDRGYRIGSTTGYTRSAAEIAIREGARQGYRPDATVTADEVPNGRPAPWMLFENLRRLGVYPPAAVVKIGDTKVDIGEGLNAGAWTIGVAATGNYVARTAEQLAAMDSDARHAAIDDAAAILRAEGAHYVVDSIADVIPILDDVERRLSNGDRP